MEPYFFAAVGDVHGCMNRMNDLLAGWCKSTGNTLAFALQVGDFEPHRHEQDLATMAAPAKYRILGDFKDYVSGYRQFLQPTYFIGGNHEPYGYLDTMPSGGELIDNCHYFGRAAVKKIQGQNIAGLSGIYVEDIYTGHRAPLERMGSTSNKAYIGFTENEVLHLLEAEPIDILLLHDWPKNIIHPQDKAMFQGRRRAIDISSIGNEPARMLVDLLKPKLVLCGHMHCRYQRTIPHLSGGSTSVYCLADIRQEFKALAFFRVDEAGCISEVTTRR